MAISLPFIGNTVGWIMTEMGRQTLGSFRCYENGRCCISQCYVRREVLFSLVSFTSLYLIIGGITVYLFVRIIKGHENKKAKQDSQKP